MSNLESGAQQPRPALTEAYLVVATRRAQFDNLLWQVPVLSLTAQAFLFSIALAPDSSRLARVVAATLSLLMTGLSLHLMSRHRQAEVADSHWLEAFERHHASPVPGMPWPVHGAEWAAYRNATDPGVGRAWRHLAKFGGFLVWTRGLLVFGLAALAVLAIALWQPSWLTTR